MNDPKLLTIKNINELINTFFVFVFLINHPYNVTSIKDKYTHILIG